MKPLDRGVVAIIAIALLELVALLKGVNGRYLIVGVVAIAGLGGYSLVQYFKRNRETNRSDKSKTPENNRQ